MCLRWIKMYWWMHRPNLKITDSWLENQGGVEMPHDVKSEVELIK